MADYSRRLKALELQTRSLPQSEEEFRAAERRLREAADAAVRKGADKWTCALFRLRKAGYTMLDALERAELPYPPDYPGKADDEALVNRHREATGWVPPLAEHTEERAAEMLEEIYGNVLQRIGATDD